MIGSYGLRNTIGNGDKLETLFCFFKPLEIGQYWENILAQEVEHVRREIGNYQQYNPEVQYSER